MDDARRKILAGAQLRRLRTTLGLSQSAMAAELGISVSYFNLVERNQRPLTAQLLIRLSETYAIDVHAFSGTEEAGALAEVEAILADPLLRGVTVPRAELRAAIDEAPGVVTALRRLHAAWAELAEARAGLAEGGAEREGAGREPGATAGDAVERVRGFLQRESNHFPGLEALAEPLAAELAEGGDVAAAIRARLLARHGTRVAVLPHAEMGVTLRHHDRHRRRLTISELLEPAGRTFQMAVQLGLMEGGAALDEALADSGLDDAPARRLGRITLANYLAAAILMPYGPFLASAQALAYDVEMLAARWGASWEQVAHRLTTLARREARGVPFFLIRVDIAGNVSKRFSSGAFPFAKAGGTCPRWSLHATFGAPGRTLTQLIELPDGQRWISVARTVRRLALPWGEPDAPFAVALGCEVRWASHLCYGRALKDAQATGIGVTCRLCERAACPSRAAPPLMAPLEVSEATRGLSPFG